MTLRKSIAVLLNSHANLQARRAELICGHKKMKRLINNHLAVYETEGVHCPLSIRTLIESKTGLGSGLPWNLLRHEVCPSWRLQYDKQRVNLSGTKCGIVEYIRCTAEKVTAIYHIFTAFEP